MNEVDEALAAVENGEDGYWIIEALVLEVRCNRRQITELDAVRARIADLEAVVESLHYRMTCVDPEPTRDEIVSTLARARKDADR